MTLSLKRPGQAPGDATDGTVVDRNGALPGDVKDAMTKLGAIIVPPAKATPDGLRTHLKAEIDKWGPIIKAAGQYAD